MDIISPIIETLKSQGVKLSDKSKQALSVAGYEAKDRRYRYLYDDNILSGLVKTNTICTGLFESFSLEPSDILTNVYLPLPKHIEYRQPHGKVSEVRQKRLYKQGLRQGSTDTRLYSTREDLLEGLTGYITTTDLLLQALSKPAAFSAIQSQGVSINKVKRYVNSLNLLEPDIETQKIVLGIKNKKITVDAFDYSSASKLPTILSNSSSESSVRSNIIVTEKQKFIEEIKELEWLINKHNVSEHELQKFFEKNPSLIMGADHIKTHAQLSLVREDLGELRPDFFLERIDGGFCDVLDIKLPKEKLVVGKDNRRTFSSAISSAVGQLREYRNYFDEKLHRDIFQKKYALESYKPDIMVVIGRSNCFKNTIERQALTQELSNLKIMTYDDILARANNQLKLMS
ncbi:Shedu anti-phage system protein SduA domain-containing protein [Vibrio harveyi]